jgi:hypothetical protein
VAESAPSHSGGNSTRNGAYIATAISAMAAQPWRRKRIQAAAATVMLVAMTRVAASKLATTSAQPIGLSSMDSAGPSTTMPATAATTISR